MKIVGFGSVVQPENEKEARKFSTRKAAPIKRIQMDEDLLREMDEERD